MIKISCVIPVRDSKGTISRAVKSIIRQTVKEWELIIVDDHSTDSDALLKEISQFTDRRINVYQLNDENGSGIACARNFGNMMARGRYIAVMDADDECLPNRFEQTLNAFDKKNADLVYSDIINFDIIKGIETSRDKNYLVRGFDFQRLKKYDYIPHPTVSYKKEIARAYPYNSFFCVAEDYDFLLRLAIKGYKFAFINQKLIKYYHNPNKKRILKYDYSKYARDI